MHQDPRTQAITERRADLDWLRVLAFGLLIFFHAAVVFVPSPIPMVANCAPSIPLQMFVAFLQEFRLGLLFLVSGIGVCFAQRHRSSKEFLKERTQRLLVPLIFGILFVVPPMVYLERMHLQQVTGSFASFYPSVFTSGPYPGGNLSWHHYWFVAYLFLFCLVGLPLFRPIERPRFMAFAGWFSRTRRLWLLVLPLIAVELLLRPFFPGFRDLIHDWASFAQWLWLFLFGFVAARCPLLLESCVARKGEALGIGIVTSCILFLLYFSENDAHFSPVHNGSVGVVEYVMFATLKATNTWAWLLTCLGYAGRYLCHSSPVLKYLTEAVYPVFCLHLTILVAIAYCVVPLVWPTELKYMVISMGTLLGSLVIYEVLVKRVAVLRRAFGMKLA